MSEAPSDVLIDNRLVVRNSPIEGSGLFFADDVRQGTVLIRLGGKLVRVCPGSVNPKHDQARWRVAQVEDPRPVTLSHPGRSAAQRELDAAVAVDGEVPDTPGLSAGEARFVVVRRDPRHHPASRAQPSRA